MTNVITELQKLLERERTVKLICAELNNFVDLKSTLYTVIEHIKKLTQCEAVGIRLHDDDDYPYFVSAGFPDTFIIQENSLCTKDSCGNRIKDPDTNKYLLDCMCGNIVRGRFDPSLSFFTENGSFWSNNTSALLASTSEDERQSRTRNYCNSCGYESVALIPIKARNERVGLIQINEKKTGMFNDDLIEYIEMIGEQVGLAVQNGLVHTKLKETLEEIKVLRGIIPICANCKNIRDDMGYWRGVEEYISKRSDADFSHSICPECIKELYPEIYTKQYETKV